MDLINTASCGVQEIEGLSSIPTAKDAMMEFCSIVFEPGGVKYITSKSYDNSLYCYYLFTAAFYDEQYKATWGRKGLRSYEPYGDEFAALIKENGLGQVFGGEAVVNRAFHTEHSNKAWLWVPDQEALKKWFEANGGKVGVKMGPKPVMKVPKIKIDQPVKLGTISSIEDPLDDFLGGIDE